MYLLICLAVVHADTKPQQTSSDSGFVPASAPYPSAVNQVCESFDYS